MIDEKKWSPSGKSPLQKSFTALKLDSLEHSLLEVQKRLKNEVARLKKLREDLNGTVE